MANLTEACSSLIVKSPSPTPMQNFGRGAVEESLISMPYLDDNLYPNAIALPLQGNSLFSLMANSSEFLLPKFYILSMRCLSSSNFNKKDLMTFNHQFYKWIISSVIPHVHENDRWYPGFGGVLRIVETMNQKGLKPGGSFRPEVTTCNNNVEGNFKELEPCKIERNEPWYRKWFVVMAFVVAGVFLLCCCLCCCMIKLCRPSEDQETKEEKNEGITNTLVQIYCGVKDSLVKGKPPENQENTKGRATECSKMSQSTQKTKSRSTRKGSERRYYSETDESTEASSSQ